MSGAEGSHLLFTHASDVSRTATLSAQHPPGGVPTAVVSHTGPNGKTRTKTIKDTSKLASLRNVQVKALSFLLGEGYILRGPQEGPLRWLTWTEEKFPHGDAFAVDEATGSVWVGDTGFLRRVQPHTCGQVSYPIGPNMPRAVGCGGGHVFALVDPIGGDLPESGPWLPPAQGGLAHTLVRLDGTDVRQLLAVPFEPSGAVAGSIAVSSGGLVFGPHADGAAVYEADGKAIETYTVAQTEHTWPRVAISASGNWLAMTITDGAIRLVDRAGRRTHEVAAHFSQIHELTVLDDGTCYAGGFLYPSWGLYRVLPPDRAERISSVTDATVAANGQSLIEVEHDRVTQRAITAQAEEGPVIRAALLPLLGMAKRGRALFMGKGEDEVVVHTDANTLAGVDLRQLAAGGDD